MIFTYLMTRLDIQYNVLLLVYMYLIHIFFRYNDMDWKQIFQVQV